MLISCDEDGLTGIWFLNSKHFGSTLKGDEKEEDPPEDLKLIEAVKWLDMYFKGEIPKGYPRFSVKGTVFQKKVWKELLCIPYGSTATYGDIAKKIFKDKGRNAGARAVGSAVGRNPLSVMVPCHRVIGKDGSITGYAAGTEIKEQLLSLEKNGHLKDE